MFNFLDNLRGRSEGYRKGVALATSFVVTFSIFFVWATIKFPNIIPGGATLAGRDSGDLVAAEEVRSASFASAIFSKNNPSDRSTRDAAGAAVASVRHNTASAFEAVKGQLRALGKRFGETQYEAEDGEVEVVPSGARNSNNSATNKGNSVIY
jgi:hypothetical protein